MWWFLNKDFLNAKDAKDAKGRRTDLRLIRGGEAEVKTVALVAAVAL